MSSYFRLTAVDPASVPTPPTGRSSIFIDVNDLSYKAKLSDGSIIPISTTPEYIQDVIGAFFEDSDTIDFSYDDSGNMASMEVIQSALDVFQIPVDTDGFLTSTNLGDFLNEVEALLSEEQTVIVSKNPGTGQFSSWKNAIDSILDASASKPYIIKGGPGIYIEDTLTLKPFIVLQGSDDGTTIIEVDDPSKTAIIGSINSEMRNIGIRGSTDTNTDLVYFQANGNSGGFSLIECALGSAYRLVHVEGDGFPTFFRMEGTRIYNDAVFTEGFLVDKASTGIVQGFFADLIYQKLTGPYPDILFRGTNGSRVILNAVTIETAGNTTHGIYLDNGSRLDVITAALSGMDNAVYLPNTGTAPNIQIEQLTLRDNNNDLIIEHPGASGNFSGNADFTKVAVEPNADVALFYSDNVAGGIASSGSLRLGRRHEILYDGLDLLEGTPVMGIVFGGFLSDNGGFDVGVGAGFGYLVANDYPDHEVKRLDWETTSITLQANEDVYIYFNSNELLTSSASIGNTDDIILIGRVVTNNSGIELIDQSPLLSRNAVNYINRAMRNGFGSVYSSGSNPTENSTPFKLDVTAGEYFYGFNRYTPSGGLEIEFIEYYRDGIGGFSRTVTDLINNTHYDDGSGTLQALTAGYYTAHTLYINCDNGDEKYFLVLGQQEYSALAAVESSPLPTPPTWLKDAVTPIARIVIKEGSSNIETILDIKPTISFKSSGVSASADHGNLIGLSDDDHVQYLLVNGGRALSGNLNLGGNNITNVNMVDGVDVSAHASRHLPNGADPLTTAAPTSVLNGNSTNTTGTANSIARSDHTHELAIATALIAGLMSTSDFSKLAGIESGATADQNANEVPLTPSGDIAASNVQDAIYELDTEKQPRDEDLTALAALSTTGLITRTGAGTAVTRTLTGTAGQIDVANGNGVSGNPTISLPNVGTAGSFGANNQSLSVTVDGKGRVSAITTQAIAILSSQVTNFAASVLNTLLTGFAIGSDTAIAATDSILAAFGKVQGQLNSRVVGPATSTDNAITRYDGATGKLVQNSSAFVDDNGGIVAGNLIRPGDSSDTTNANIRYNSNEMQARVNGTWRNLAIVPTELSETGNTSTTSGTYSVMSGMASTPAAGTYMVIFECSADLGDDTTADIALFVNNSEVANKTKTLQIFANGGFGPTGAAEFPVVIIAFATVNGAQPIDIRFRENGGGTLTIGPRTLTLIPIAR